MVQRMHFPISRFFRFPVLFSILLLGLLGRIDTAQAQGQDTLTASPSTYTFNSPVGGGFQTTTIQIGSSAAPLNYSVSYFSAQNWLVASTTQTVTPGQVAVNVNPGNLGVGTYTGTVTVTPSGASTTPLVIPINLVISTASSITLNPAAFTFMATAGSTTPTSPQLLNVSSATNGINFNVTTGYNQQNVPSWLSVAPTSGITNTSLSITANPSGLAAGTYTATITVSTAQGAAQVANVTFTVAGLPTLTSNLTTIPFFYQIGQSPTFDSSALLTISSGSNSNVPINVTTSTSSCPGFLGISQQGALTTPATVQVYAVNLPGFTQPQTCNGQITVTSSATTNSSITIPVTLTVSNGPLVLVTPLMAAFTYQLGGTVPANQNLTISSTTSGLPFTASSNQPWLAVTTAGTTSTSSQISLNLVPSQLTNLIPGMYQATVTVSASGAANSPITIPVTLSVGANSMLTLTPPFANFVYEMGQQLSLNSQQIQIGTTGGQIPFTIAVPSTTGTQFVTVSPLSGVAPATITVSASPTGLSSGVFNETIQVIPTNGGASPRSFPVQGGTVQPQTIGLTSTDVAIPLTISNVTVNSSWLTTSFIPGSNLMTPGNLQVSVNPVFLTPSATPYTANLTISTTTPQNITGTTTIPVTLNYTSGVTLTSTPGSLTFAQVANGAAPAAQSLNIGASGTTGATLPISVTVSTVSGGNWLTASATTGTAPATIMISVNSLAATLPAGTYQGSVVIFGQGAANPNGQLTVPVTLTVTAAPNLSVNPVSLTFSANVGGSSPATQTVAVTAPGAIGPVTFTTSIATASGGNWLSVTGASSTPATLTVTAALLSSLAQGTYNGTITLTPSGGGAPTTIPVSFNVGAQLAPAPTQVINAASGASGSISPGEIVSIFGSGLGPVSPAGLTLNTQGNVTTTLAGVTVTFNGVPAPLTYVSATQINAVVPYEVASATTAQMQISYNGSTSGATALMVQATTPGIFTQNSSGSGPGAILKPDYSTVTPSNPAPRGSTIIIYATGGGQTTPASVTGAVAGGSLLKTNAAVTVTIGGIAATVSYAGSAPGLVEGVLQLNVVVPTTISAGSQPILVTVGNATSQNGVTVAVQ
jgi:uncharacterized protein (TIGR03437 family)